MKKRTLITVILGTLIAVTLTATAWAQLANRPSQTQAGGTHVVPISGIALWTTVRDAGGLDSADNATLTNVATQITSGLVYTLDLDRRGGTFVTVRMAYAGTVTQNPVVKAFGRSSTAEAWQVLRTKSGSTTATIAVDGTNDATNGTLKYTTPDLDTQLWDTQGCRFVVFGLQTPQSGGTASTAFLQAKSF